MSVIQASASALSPAELDAFRADGFLVVRRLASADVCREMRQLTLRHLAEAQLPLEYEADTHYQIGRAHV